MDSREVESRGEDNCEADSSDIWEADGSPPAIREGESCAAEHASVMEVAAASDSWSSGPRLPSGSGLFTQLSGIGFTSERSTTTG